MVITATIFHFSFWNFVSFLWLHCLFLILHLGLHDSNPCKSSCSPDQSFATEKSLKLYCIHWSNKQSIYFCEYNSGANLQCDSRTIRDRSTRCSRLHFDIVNIKSHPPGLAVRGQMYVLILPSNGSDKHLWFNFIWNTCFHRKIYQTKHVSFSGV